LSKSLLCLATARSGMWPRPAFAGVAGAVHAVGECTWQRHEEKHSVYLQK